MKKIFIIGIVILALLILAWAAVFVFPASVSWISSGPSSLATTTSQSQGTTSADMTGLGKSSGRAAPAGELEYYNPYYHFSLLYPNTLKAGEHSEDGGAMTVTFEDIEQKTVSGFQIFIVPFEGSQITDERFKEDTPSGVRQNLKNISVGGAVGAEFDSTDTILGATHEVWFIKGGYLYELTTFKELGPWLDSVVQTWTFI